MPRYRRKPKNTAHSPAAGAKRETGSAAPKATATKSQPLSPSASPGQLMEQKRARFALSNIQQVQTCPPEVQREVKAYSRRLPGMIQVNGFGQAVAFFFAKANASGTTDNGYRILYALVEEWLCHAMPDAIYASTTQQSPASTAQLLAAITNSDQHLYRQAEAETRALLIWVKKFCEGLIVIKKD